MLVGKLSPRSTQCTPLHHFWNPYDSIIENWGKKELHCVDLEDSFQTHIYLVIAKCGFDTAENEPSKVCRKSRGGEGEGRSGREVGRHRRFGCRVSPRTRLQPYYVLL